MSWETNNPDVTNLATITDAALGPYPKSTDIYRCPSDHVLSQIQKQLGWKARIRSYSMNAMVGDAGEISINGTNRNNPYYVQFFRITDIPQPAKIFVFLDEHPDSINDGYFVNRAYLWKWLDLPASYHLGATSFSFADGHSDMHRWIHPQTKPPSLPEAAGLPFDTAKYDEDLGWIINRMSVESPQASSDSE